MSGYGVGEVARRLTAQRLARVALVAFLEGHSCLRGPTMRFDCASAWCGLRVWCELRDLRLAPGEESWKRAPQSSSLHVRDILGEMWPSLMGTCASMEVTCNCMRPLHYTLLAFWNIELIIDNRSSFCCGNCMPRTSITQNASLKQIYVNDYLCWTCEGTDRGELSSCGGGFSSSPYTSSVLSSAAIPSVA
jgi:hypothetical protein